MVDAGQVDEFVRAIRKVTAGGSVLDPRIIDALLERNASAAPHVWPS